MAIRKPITREVLDEKSGKVFHGCLKEPCYCNQCEKIVWAIYSGETPEDKEYWECSDCGNTDIKLNKVSY